ncbi:MAG: hypothetical protein GEU90_05000 [Gemmatimonas sp.]|nr:hypothetical protein [Gemmatimonas sp.]
MAAIGLPAELDAFHLPGIPPPSTTTWSPGDEGRTSLRLRVAQLTPPLLVRLIDGLLDARTTHLAEKPVEEIAAAIGRVASRFLDPASELRRTAAFGLREVTGLSGPVIEQVIDGMAADWKEDALLDLLTAEFGDFHVLDEFAPTGSGQRRVRAFGPPLAVHVFSGNVPGVSVTSVIRSLLTKSAVLGKTATAEPILAPLFASALAAEDAALGACLSIAYWPGGEPALEEVAFERAGAVIVYGGRETVEAVRARVAPGTTFLGYGHRVSFGIVLKELLEAPGAAEVARAAALAVATFDQQGCVSPHLFYVEDGGEVSAREWCSMLGTAMAEIERVLPRGRVAPGEAAAIQAARTEAEFAHLSDRGQELHASKGDTAWTAIFDPDPTFNPSCLNRLVRVKPILEVAQLPDLIRPVAPVLQTVGIAGSPARIAPLADELARLGASRITAVGRMAWPPPEWHHDGRPPLADLVRWCDWE